jgi:acyl carrier protein
MSDDLHSDVRRYLAAFVGVGLDDFEMDADLTDVYGMDSTELTALAQELHQRFGTWVDRGDRQDWATGDHICRFLEGSVAPVGRDAS